MIQSVRIDEHLEPQWLRTCKNLVVSLELPELVFFSVPGFMATKAKPRLFQPLGQKCFFLLDVRSEAESQSFLGSNDLYTYL